MLIWVGWGRDWSSLGHAGGGDKPQHCLAHLSPGGYGSVEGVLVLDSLRCPVWMKTDPSRVLLPFLWEGAGKILKLWAISETSQTHSFRSPSNVGISMDINRAWGGWGYGDYLKKKVIWVIKFCGRWRTLAAHCQETHAHGHPRGHPHMLGFPPHQISRQPWLSQMVFAIII